MANDEDDQLLTEAQRNAFVADEPPAGFAERVAGAWDEERTTRPPRRRGFSIVVGALTLAAAAAMLLWLRLPPAATATGDREVSERTSFEVGRRATAVAEPGAALSWRVATDGTARVEQRAGDVFYRVEKGGPFVVSTTAGDVTVLGTCFRVEVQAMDRKAVMAAGAGALAATTILVSVYEGRVLLANEHGRVEVAAGERGAAHGGSTPSRSDAAEAAKKLAALQAAAAPLPPPAAGASRDELLKRDTAQREELAKLRAQVAALESSSIAPYDRKSGEAFFNPSKDELLAMAKECKLKWDSPSLSLTPETMGDKTAHELGVSDEERRQYNHVMSEFDAKMIAQLRALYVEVTGDKAGADTLTPQAMETEIRSKVPDAVAQDAYWRLSHERAGLVAAPADARNAPAIERFLRLETSAGDEFERELGGAIGPDRARALRSEHGGWGSRSVSSSDCPAGR
jgi:hypothetical protein